MNDAEDSNSALVSEGDKWFKGLSHFGVLVGVEAAIEAGN